MDSSFYRDVQIPSYHARCWVESLTVSKDSLTTKPITVVPLGWLNGTKRYLAIDTTLKHKDFQCLIALVLSIQPLNGYPETPEYRLLQRAIVIMSILATTRCKRFFMRLTVVRPLMPLPPVGNMTARSIYQPLMTKFSKR